MKKKLLMLPLIILLSFTFSCSQQSSVKYEEYYDSNWKQGENAITSDMPVLKNPTGEFTVINELRRTQNKVGLPSKGEANILVVPINFSKDIANQVLMSGVDITFSNKDLENIDKTFFADASLTDLYPSVKSYYKSSSFEKLNLSGVVSPIVTLPKEYTEYLTKAYVTSTKEALNDIISYVYDYLFNVTKTYYIGDFDSDNDKRVDAISLVCNYPLGISYGDSSLDATHQELLSHRNVYFSSDISNIKETPINSFSIASDSYRTYGSANRDSHAFIYQVGRMIGLDDYEDLNGNPLTSYYRAPLGYMDMMAGLLGDHNSFSKYQLGWIEPKFICKEDISETGLTLNINASISSGDCILLYSKEKSLFGEYLIIDLYSLTGVNDYDAKNRSPYGLSLFDETGVRVYQVDSSLVIGYNDLYYNYYGELNFEETKTLINGENINYVYDYAYTNDSINEYPTSGNILNYALVSLLSKNASNRHMTDFTNFLSSEDLFLEGDSFGSDDQINGFYKDFSFHNGDLLGINFTIDKIENNSATITFRRTK